MNDYMQGLLDIATDKVRHVYNGSCPDQVEGPDVRDDECPACQIIVAAEREEAVTVRVPLSLIGEMHSYRDALTEKQRARLDMFVRLPALLSHPSRAPEAGKCVCEHIAFGHEDGRAWCLFMGCDCAGVEDPAEPPSIEGMALGATFTANGEHYTVWDNRWGVRLAVGSDGIPRAFPDPSTIRDVTPPPTTPEGAS